MASHQRAVGVFSKAEQAEQSFKQLKAKNFSMEQVSLVAKQPDQEPGTAVEVSDRLGDQNVNTPISVVQDTFAHSSWGFVLVSLTSLALPGIGPILAAGSLGAALVATVAGTGVGAVATNNLITALTDLGIPDAEARVYSDSLLQGDYLVVVEGSGDEIQQAEKVFQEQGIQNWGIYSTT